MKHHLMLVMGPHCSGKSTTVKAALAPWGDVTGMDTRITAIYADDGGAWKKPPMMMNDMLREVLRSAEPVVIVEGTHRIALSVIRTLREFSADRDLTVHVTSVTPETMRHHLAARCAKKRKPFEADYWTTKRCVTDDTYYRKLAERLPVEPWVWRIGPNYECCDVMQATIREQVTKWLA